MSNTSGPVHCKSGGLCATAAADPQQVLADTGYRSEEEMAKLAIGPKHGVSLLLQRKLSQRLIYLAAKWVLVALPDLAACRTKIKGKLKW